MLRYHHPEAQRIFELAIYRCTEDQHYKEQEARFETAAQWTKEALRILDKGPEFNAEQIERFRRDWFKREACPWDFNQIVGWIRLYAWKRNIAAYLFLVDGRISKNIVRKRFLTNRAKFLEVRVFEGQSSAEIFGRLKKRIAEESRDSPRVRGLHVDTGMLDVLGPHIDWIAITSGGSGVR